jgi:hypothetical protein
MMTPTGTYRLRQTWQTRVKDFNVLSIGGLNRQTASFGLGDGFFGRWGKGILRMRDDPRGRKQHAGPANSGYKSRFLDGLLEIGLPMKGFCRAFARILMQVVAKTGLLTVFHLDDEFYGRFGRIIGLVISIRIIIGRDIPGRRTANTEVQYLQGDDPEKELPAYI